MNCMTNPLRPISALHLTGWLLVLLVAEACQWDLDTRAVDRCTSPTAQISSSATLLTVTFRLTEPTGTINDVRWTFGDGQTANAPVDVPVSHTYATAATYFVRATLTNLCADTLRTPPYEVTVSNVVPATVTIQEVTGITATAATLRMTVTSNGNGVISRYGLCYSATDTMPTIQSPNLVAGRVANPAVGAEQAFAVGQLQPKTVYYVRAFATNNSGPEPVYSSEVRSFTTVIQPPVVSTVGTNSTDATTATVLFRLDQAGTPPATRYGVCYSSSSEVPGVGVGNSMTVDVSKPVVGAQMPVALANLMPNTSYWYRSFAVYAGGELPVYGGVQQFRTTIDDLTTDLILYVPFDNRNADDISGQGNHATLVGQPRFVANRGGTAESALDFDGVDDYLVMADKAGQFTDQFTISWWIRPTAKVLQSRMQLFMKNRVSDGEHEELSAIIKPVPAGSSATKAYANFDVKQVGDCKIGAGWRNIEVSDLILTDQWQHVAYVYAGKTMKQYHNGKLVRDRADLPRSVVDDCPGGKLTFGILSQVSPDYFQGAMDDIRIYRRALTDAQVTALANQ